MLDQLVESKNNSRENRRKSEFILVIGFLAVVSLLTMWTVSLLGKDFGVGGDDLELTTLVAPPPPADEPPPPKPEKQPEKQPDVDVRKELIQNMMQTPVKPPDNISTTRNQVKEMRLDRLTKLGGSDSDTGALMQGSTGRVVADGGTGGLSTTTGTGTGGGDEEAPAPRATPKPIPKTVSGGVLNGKATSLPKPAYPPAARAVRASGAVNVQVTISESGSVISASAVSGHPLLRAAAESAARGAHFSPTLLSGQPVKVTGVITYNFVP
ncbi:MAG TPA: energy transducer TonB [Pyrinomonadaceae bacterium]|jgi:protein TonB|nr:energy transducer TonB [Pyrinomonadaceae bacterium]